MYISLLKSKIHDCVVTDANLEYVGSITLDVELMEAAGILENEKVLVANITNGRRIETYVIKGGGGEVILNGAAAHLFKKGDRAIVMAFAMVDVKEAKTHKPKIIHVDKKNKIRD
ncbi:MAG: aspartate 1-decarboxylase [Candidatus Altiarchaeota archaeon]|nr:aspartate 1-decarboxylase [Candidatus Altiarchaeota archaeon]